MRRILLLIVVLVPLMTGCVPVEFATQTSSNVLMDLEANNTLGQTLYSTEKNLNRIDVKLSRSPGKRPPDLLLKVKQAPGARRSLAVEKLRGANMISEEFNSFTFSPIKNSKDKTFYFVLELHTPQPGASVTVFLSSGDPYSKGQAYVNDKPESRKDVTFRAFVDVGARQVAGLGIKRILDDKLFSVFYLLLILTIGTVLVLLTAREKKLRSNT